MKNKLPNKFTDEEKDQLLLGACQMLVEIEKQIAKLSELIGNLLFLITPPEGEC